ncbi:MAG TPA: hypothetical protein VFW22_16455 [Pseudolabrys sp.]|nr:hypothetical protein [Pseudolabrys sp.]
MVQGPLSYGLQAGLQIGQGLIENQGYREQAARYEENARQSLLAGALQETQIRHQERAVSGQAIVAQAENGVAIGSGSALDLLAQNAVNREVAVLNTRYSADAQAYGYRTKAADARSAGQRAIIGSVISAGTQVLTGMRQDARQAQIAQAQRDYPGGLQLPGVAGTSSGGVYGSTAPTTLDLPY